MGRPDTAWLQAVLHYDVFTQLAFGLPPQIVHHSLLRACFVGRVLSFVHATLRQKLYCTLFYTYSHSELYYPLFLMPTVLNMQSESPQARQATLAHWHTCRGGDVCG